jgi:hypothetical protein
MSVGHASGDQAGTERSPDVDFCAHHTARLNNLDPSARAYGTHSARRRSQRIGPGQCSSRVHEAHWWRATTQPGLPASIQSSSPRQPTQRPVGSHAGRWGSVQWPRSIHSAQRPSAATQCGCFGSQSASPPQSDRQRPGMTSQLAPKGHCSSPVHSTQRWRTGSHVRPSQWASSLHSTQTWRSESQAGAITSQSLSAVHATQRPERESHAGLSGVRQSPLDAHSTQ